MLFLHENSISESFSAFDCSSAFKISALHYRILRGLRNYSEFNLLLQLLFLVPSSVYFFLSASLWIFFGFIFILSYIPFWLAKIGNWILNEISSYLDDKYSGFDFLEILLFVPVIIYIPYFIALILLALPSSFGLDDYFDFPGYVRGLRINWLIVRLSFESFLDSDFIVKLIFFSIIFLFVPVFSLLALVIDLFGCVFSFIPWILLICSNKIIDFAIDLCDSRLESGCIEFLIIPLIVYLASFISITLVIAPGIVAAILW